PFAGMAYPADPDSEGRRFFLRGGADPTDLNGGRAYIFHNTILQPAPLAGETQPSGAGYGIKRDGGALMYNFVSKNNIWHIWRTDSYFKSISGDSSELTADKKAMNAADYDLYNGGYSHTEFGSYSPTDRPGTRVRRSLRRPRSPLSTARSTRAVRGPRTLSRLTASSLSTECPHALAARREDIAPCRPVPTPTL